MSPKQERTSPKASTDLYARRLGVADNPSDSGESAPQSAFDPIDSFVDKNDTHGRRGPTVKIDNLPCLGVADAHVVNVMNTAIHGEGR
jgi:hypothetical protein